MYLQELPFEVESPLSPLSPLSPGRRPVRSFVATLLRGAGRALDTLAQKLSLVDAPPAEEPHLEYHGDAAAPEGALYVNGVLVGRLLGVNRL